MGTADLVAALLLPLPPWLGFWIFRRKGRVGLSYGYFLGGILAVLALPWPYLTGLPVPSAQLGGALFGFTLFLQAQREGVQGLRRLAIGVGGSTGFLALLLARLGLPWQGIGWFWAGAGLEALLWLLGADLAYRWARGRHLEIRMPLVGAAALGLGALVQTVLPGQAPTWAWPGAVLGGLLLGFVALQQLRWLRAQGAWVEGRGEGLRVALSLLDQRAPGGTPSLALGLEASQPMWIVDARGRILESNGPLSHLVGLPRHELRGYPMEGLFQGGETSVWEGLQAQLLQFGSGALSATQVSQDGSFRPVDLQATPFDRGMALVWLQQPTPGALQLRSEGALSAAGASETRRKLANALLTLGAAGELASQEGVPASGGWVGLVSQAVPRLDPSLGARASRPALAAGPMLEGLVSRLGPALPPRLSLHLEAEDLQLPVEPETLARIATPMVLHAAACAESGSLRLLLQAVELGGQPLALLQVRGPADLGSAPLFGLGWLREAVLGAGGLLELDQERSGPVHPRVYLPRLIEVAASAKEGHTLSGRRLWVVDGDPLVRETLLLLLGRWGAEASAFPDLRHLLRQSRDAATPDLLVMERTPHLERFQGILRSFRKLPIPTLVLGMGDPLPLSPDRLGVTRVGFLEKPFPPSALRQSLLALLRNPAEPVV